MSFKMDINGDWHSSIPNLQNNLCILSPDQIELAKALVEIGQSHLFDYWHAPGTNDEYKMSFFAQVAWLNSSYPGGLTSYIQNARELLVDSKAGKNPFDGFIPSVPTGENLCFGDDKYISFEEAGIKEAQKAAFVLVAGGLGERLGYNGIKVVLPSETTTETSFLQHYVEYVLALQKASCKATKGDRETQIPFVIMTSDDTHSQTLRHLELNGYFGMEPTQVKLLKQEKVACLNDNEARLAIDPYNKYKIQTKPHGHGDVHSLLYTSSLLNEWRKAGLNWVLFVQDTNGLLFKAIPASLGVSSIRGFHVNSLCVLRKAKEPMGGITKLSHADGRTMVINVEYNQLDPLLRATGYSDGDVNSESGYSPFPGNINQLILELGPYLEELTRTKGAIKEFVNPKYKDAGKTSFKSSTRLECMMQDYPKTLPPSARVGFTVPKGNPYHSATSGEMAIYKANCLILRKAGVQIGNPIIQVFNGQEVEVWPRIAWKPQWGFSFSEVKRKVCGSSSISQKSSLIINDRNVIFDNLTLDGALVISSGKDSEVKVEGSVQNKGWVLENVDYKDTSIPEEIRIRGFRINKIEQCLKP